MSKIEKTTIAAGCFWCSEAVFQNVKGIEKITPGFMGGNIKNPAYREVITGRTGHAEVVQMEFDSDVLSYEELLTIFFCTHDPTSVNRQGNDVGTQYRSMIFYHSKTQQELAKKVKSDLNQRTFDDKIVTEIYPVGDFYPAEDIHKQFYTNNPDEPYCRVVIDPKVQKLRAQFSDKLKV